jgi:hypothetical protein
MMMTQTSEKARKMLSDFSNAQMFKCVAVACAIHFVIIFGASAGYIVDAIRGTPPVVATAPTGGAADTQPASAPAGAAAATTGSDDAKTMEARKTSPMIQKITATAKAPEIPTQPAGGGIDLDDSRR